MKIVLTLTVLSAGLLLAAGNSEGDTSKKIRELHRERIAALQQAVDVLTAQQQNAISSQEDVLQARLLVLNAELDASEAGPERVKLREDVVKLLKEKEAGLSRSRGIVDPVTILNAKADRIKAEIALEEAKK